MPDASRVLHFHSNALPADTLLVNAMEGVEEVSNLYRFEVDLVSKKADIDLDLILEAPASLAMKVPVKVKGGSHAWRLQKWSGTLSLFRQEEQLFDWVRYHAVLVPRIWTLSLNVLTRIFMDATVRDIPETASPVTGGNATQCAIHTGGGNSITIEDTDGSQSMTLHTPSGNTTISIGLA
ncbi:MAG TPA: contractile injection system protein, VgrG/Pvc8 family [Planctomycetota bacterium]|nr:contractile injection system protein, VgrG/Pvc8 family [Planctomycetota bacterium]